MRCAVFGCVVDNMCKGFIPGTKFFSFPKDKEMQGVWIQQCKRKDRFNVKFARICDKHFIESDYERNLKYELLGYTPAKHRPLKKEAIPSKHLPKTIEHKSNSDRTNHQNKRQQKEPVEDILNRVENSNSRISSGGAPSTSSSCHISEDHSEEVVEKSTTQSIGVNTEEDHKDKLILELQQKIEFLEKRQDLIRKLFSEEQLKKLEHSKTRLRWKVDDISKAIVIYSAGPRAYRLLLKRGYPFPAVSCIRSWQKKVKIAPGILKNA